MMKTPDPITGGSSCPPSEAEFSTAPATTGRNPTRFISGMVKVPVETMLARLLPEIDPKTAEASTATLAGPPADRPAMVSGNSMKNFPMPELCMNAPRKMKIRTYWAMTVVMIPKMPSCE